VIRRLGEPSKMTYANMLIDMEMKKGSSMPLCTILVKMRSGITVSFATSASDIKVENDYKKQAPS